MSLVEEGLERVSLEERKLEEFFTRTKFSKYNTNRIFTDEKINGKRKFSQCSTNDLDQMGVFISGDIKDKDYNIVIPYPFNLLYALYGVYYVGYAFMIENNLADYITGKKDEKGNIIIHDSLKEVLPLMFEGIFVRYITNRQNQILIEKYYPEYKKLAVNRQPEDSKAKKQIIDAYLVQDTLVD